MEREIGLQRQNTPGESSSTGWAMNSPNSGFATYTSNLFQQRHKNILMQNCV